jgi:hypothetical protein
MGIFWPIVIMLFDRLSWHIELFPDRIGHMRLDEALSRRPNVDPMSLLDPTGSKLIRTRSTNSAKSAFLCPTTNKVKKVQMAVATW